VARTPARPGGGLVLLGLRRKAVDLQLAQVVTDGARRPNHSGPQ
jgi:hypothetical protein